MKVGLNFLMIFLGNKQKAIDPFPTGGSYKGVDVSCLYQSYFDLPERSTLWKQRNYFV